MSCGTSFHIVIDFLRYFKGLKIVEIFSEQVSNTLKYFALI